MHLDRLDSAAEDIASAIAIADRALARVHQELSDARARANGQAELPLPDGAAAAAAPVPPRRATLLGYLDDLEDALERGDAERAVRAARSLRTAIEDL